VNVVNQPRLNVGTNMGLHSEEILITFNEMVSPARETQ